MSSSRHPSKLYELEITIVSAKHLKNVNWRHGDLKPYVTFWLEPGNRFTTKPDEFGSTRPVWNERFTVPVNLPLQDSLLSLEICHSETPSPLVGTLQFPLKDLVNSEDPSPLRNLELRRPSGRPQGKIRLKLSVRERPAPPPPPSADYLGPPSYYYSSAPPPPPRDYRGGYASPPPPYSTHMPPPAPAPAPPPPSPYTYGGYSDPYPGYYSGYYSQPPPPPPPRPFFDRSTGYASPSGPSAPVVDYSSYDQKPKGSKMGLGTGLAVGAVAGMLGGLALEEGLKYEEEKIVERVENDLGARDDYSDYRAGTGEY